MRVPYISVDSAAEEVWKRVKAWAKERACKGEATPPTIRECATEVERIVRSVSGPDGSFPPSAVEFYAAEAFSMIESLRASTS